MIPLPEHWQYVALGALSMTPFIGVFWSVARGWRLKALAIKAELETARDWADVERHSFGSQIAEREGIIADQSDRLGRIIERAKTKNPNNTVKAMVRIATGEE